MIRCFVNAIVLIPVVFFAVMTILFTYIVTVNGQDIHQHPPQDQAIHEKFYSDWRRPPNRTTSCCSLTDCYPLDNNNLKMNGGKWFIFNKFTNQWTLVPESLIESNQPDPRESPDGRGHVCANWTGVLCFVLGSQI